jgi:amino acid transporter
MNTLNISMIVIAACLVILFFWLSSRKKYTQVQLKDPHAEYKFNRDKIVHKKEEPEEDDDYEEEQSYSSFGNMIAGVISLLFTVIISFNILPSINSASKLLNTTDTPFGTAEVAIWGVALVAGVGGIVFALGNLFMD